MMPGVHQHNERVICLFATPLGRVAVVLVGAMNVGTIETSWHGIVAPSWRRKTVLNYQSDRSAVHLRRGDDLACFHLGSSVVVLLENERLAWNPEQKQGQKLLLGSQLASFSGETESL